MQEQSVHHVSTQLGENINAIYGITKALPYTKRNENTAYRELRVHNYCTILIWGEKKAEFNQHL